MKINIWLENKNRINRQQNVCRQEIKILILKSNRRAAEKNMQKMVFHRMNLLAPIGHNQNNEWNWRKKYYKKLIASKQDANGKFENDVVKHFDAVTSNRTASLKPRRVWSSPNPVRMRNKGRFKKTKRTTILWIHFIACHFEMWHANKRRVDQEEEVVK